MGSSTPSLTRCPDGERNQGREEVRFHSQQRLCSTGSQVPVDGARPVQPLH